MNLFLNIITLFFIGNYINAQSNYKIKPEQFKDLLLKETDALLVDVRTKAEFENGHLQNAINIDYYKKDFREKLSKLNVKTPIYLYCRSGKRSALTSLLLKELGFNNIYDLKGGYNNWVHKKYKTVP